MIEKLIKKYLKGFQASHILDVGPGYNHFGRIAAEITGAACITYMDVNTNVLKWQAEQCTKRNIRSKWVRLDLDAASLNSLEDGYDLILCQEVLEHLEDCEAVLSGLAAKLKPGGRVLITVPTQFSERWLKFLNSSYMRDELYGHVREFDKKELRRVMRLSGLKPLMVLSIQPHMFISHTWLFGTHVKVEGATGKILDSGWRIRVWKLINKISFAFFRATGIGFWGNVFPRNYFAIAERNADANRC